MTVIARTRAARASPPHRVARRRRGRGTGAQASPEATSERSSSSSIASSRAVWNRRSGSLTRQRRMILASCRGQRRRQLGDRGGRVAEDGGHHRGGAVAPEGSLSGGHLVEDDAQGEEVRALVDRLALHLLGGHVGDRAERPALLGQRLGGQRSGLLRRRLQPQFGQPEVQHLHPAVVGHHDIAGFQVAMDDALFVRCREGIG